MTPRGTNWSERNGRQGAHEVSEGFKEGSFQEGQREAGSSLGRKPTDGEGRWGCPCAGIYRSHARLESAIGRQLDALIVRNVPNVRKAVRWNSPFFGIEGQSWFLNYHVFTSYVKVTFFLGASLQPVPPGLGKDKDSRWIDIYENGIDEKQLANWISQAAAQSGWDGF